MRKKAIGAGVEIGRSLTPQRSPGEEDLRREQRKPETDDDPVDRRFGDAVQVVAPRIGRNGREEQAPPASTGTAANTTGNTM